MSYNYHLVALDKSIFNKIHDLTSEQFSIYLSNVNKGEKFDNFWSVVLSRQLYDLGGLSDEIYDYIMENTDELFTQESTCEEFYDYTLKVANKNVLSEIINIYQKETQKYYQSFFKPNVLGKKSYANMSIDDIAEDRKKELFWMLYHHCISPTINLEENQPTILTSSWDYEYAVFNLVHIFKTFDWEKDVLLICGW